MKTLCGSEYQGESLRVKVRERSVRKQKRLTTSVLLADDISVVARKGD